MKSILFAAAILVCSSSAFALDKLICKGVAPTGENVYVSINVQPNRLGVGVADGVHDFQDIVIHDDTRFETTTFLRGKWGLVVYLRANRSALAKNVKSDTHFPKQMEVELQCKEYWRF